MKSSKLTRVVLLCASCMPLTTTYAVIAIDYSAVGATATGEWSDITNPSDGSGNGLGLFASMSVSGGTLLDVDTSSTPSRIAEEFPWRDVAAGETVVLPDGTVQVAPISMPLPFAAGTSGDFINVETNADSTSTVTINFGANVTNPLLSFSDIDLETTLIFTDAFSIASGTGNLQQSGMTVFNTGLAASTGQGLDPFQALAYDAIFDGEAAGSLQFSGVFQELIFQINNGPDASGEDRTGFIVTTLETPTAVPEPSNWSLLLGLIVVCMVITKREGSL